LFGAAGAYTAGWVAALTTALALRAISIRRIERTDLVDAA